MSERERERERERVKFSFRCDTKITHKVRAGLGVVVYIYINLPVGFKLVLIIGACIVNCLGLATGQVDCSQAAVSDLPFQYFVTTL